ncbi:Oidioi.mRNA.OKI2018_I69.PAR.g13208.t2.cds [Oikopleura dioica]|uniref:Oidioi.mRNA.OKI2018_I69.PAR.g13208.t2.cds n=1 Tax=Oikopleura dioica TaxID=34765 RepID=A0ABN7S3N4_OIKDI|nr:Oidioi.mRNA.OKI2018_I69.PAR.g13208.t2.cds [Oikopleura dioica]
MSRRVTVSTTSSFKVLPEASEQPVSRDLRGDICLEERMSRIDSFADRLLSMAEGLHDDMTAQNEIDELNENLNGPARPRIINQGKREMRKNKRIMAENKELRHALAEHQTVLEMVMDKFRKVSTHAAKLERERSHLAPANKTYELRKENQKLADRVGDMITIMTMAASKYPTDNDSYLQAKTKLKQLRDENQGLRSLLALSQRNGSHKLDMLSPVEKTDPLPTKIAVSDESDDESAETSSTASNDTVLSNDGSEKCSDESDPVVDGPPFHDFIEAMVKNAIDSRQKELAEENKRSENEESFLEIESVQKDEDTISLSSNASTIVENGFDPIENEEIEGTEEDKEEINEDLSNEAFQAEIDQLLEVIKTEEGKIDRSASPICADDDVSPDNSEPEEATANPQIPASET